MVLAIRCCTRFMWALFTSPGSRLQVARGRIASVEAALAQPRLQLAETLLKEYVAYPLPPTSAAWIPINYCALPKLAPWTAPFMRPFC